MRFLVPLFVFLAVAAFQSALSAHVEFAEKEEAVAHHDQMEFEAAQKNEAAQMNGKFDHNKYKQAYHSSTVLRSVCKTSFHHISYPVTEEQNDGSRYLAVEERVEPADLTTESESESSEEGDGEFVTSSSSTSKL
ncbi:hypothetical protein GBF38_009813 [Nibea albiflora]|uniref:Uncharacterized protein n=1 Tax=Nibea albiflora TaxID=240163 RepID=A0ACB7F902_NIBAL|nr:hypothetical protein GBF38_009813 [Nibea albiflora]